MGNTTKLKFLRTWTLEATQTQNTLIDTIIQQIFSSKTRCTHEGNIFKIAPFGAKQSIYNKTFSNFVLTSFLGFECRI